MEFLAWLILQAGVIALMWWIFSRRRVRSEAPMKRMSSRSEESRELKELKQMRERSLNLPLSERARPARMEDIIGQQEGIRALRAAMCGPNPQHVIIYGPPGVGKTCAARLVLEEAKLREDSPFGPHSKFVEVDATCVRFDERAIADPLLGSVHDPIYQGAGALGAQGVPQPKPGAVSRAHCGVLFLDEIGELHPLQMNKLLKVLEDRKVCFDSAYYSKENNSIPPHIHDIFQNGLPADFRLIGATTRSPEEMPPALRSRCVELFFNALTQAELERIVGEAAERIGFCMDGDALTLCASFCSSGRDAVNLVQLASGIAYGAKRCAITAEDVNWVAQVSRCSRRHTQRIREAAVPGVVSGLAVTGGGSGAIIEIECIASAGSGLMDVGGAASEEELELRQRRLRRKGTAWTSAENVKCVFTGRFGVDCSKLDIRYNVPGGIPMDGPSAGIALAVALMSALSKKATVDKLALTGEISALGEVKPVGGVREKLTAAVEGGAELVIIPEENWEDSFSECGARVCAVSDIAEVMRLAFGIALEAAPDSNVLPMICSA